MPISAEKMKRYPCGSIYSAKWKPFRAFILFSVANRCEGTSQFRGCRPHATASNATVNRWLQTLGRTLRHMAIYKADLPSLDLKRAETKEPKECVREPSMDGQARLFEHPPKDLSPYVTFCLITGARISTMACLLWDDVRGTEGEIFFALRAIRRCGFLYQPSCGHSLAPYSDHGWSTTEDMSSRAGTRL